MSPGEFVDILQTHLHPRWWSIWVDSNRWGRRQREAAGLTPDLGTVFVAKAQGGAPEQVLVVPTNCLPYITQYETILDEDGKETLGYHAAKGWPAALEHLIKAQHLKPSHRLSYLIGKDTYRLAYKAHSGGSNDSDSSTSPIL